MDTENIKSNAELWKVTSFFTHHI